MLKRTENFCILRLFYVLCNKQVASVNSLILPFLSIIDTQRLPSRGACFASLNAKFASKLVAV